MRGSNSPDRLFPYYAGFSTEFVTNCLHILNLPPDAQILDPWNGSGTTTLVLAKSTSMCAIGFDLNPVMVVVAKAQLLTRDVHESLQPLARRITFSRSNIHLANDPLCTWFEPQTAAIYRGLDKAISTTLVPSPYQDLSDPRSVSNLSGVASFYYLALFRAIRKSLHAFIPSNPTWIRIPKKPDRIALSQRQIASHFLREVRSMCTPRFRGLLPARDAEKDTIALQDRITLMVGDARKLEIPSQTTDAIISSPPYCTRIDYAVTTRPELAVLGIGSESGFDALRRNLTGTVVTRTSDTSISDDWGVICLTTINKIATHQSKASGGYYLRSFLQYFSDLYASLSEIRRVLKTGGTCILVVQDSLYKDVHVDLPAITTQMAQNLGLGYLSRADYKLPTSFRNVNTRARRYIGCWIATESVLAFKK